LNWQINRESAAGDSFSGFDLYRDSDDIDQETQLSKSEHYLGLNVDGKKKKGWVNQHNPDARNSKDLPLLHIAMSSNNRRSIEYLLGGRPMNALRQFAKNHPNDRRTTVLRTDKELRHATQRLLGFGAVNESTPLHAAILTDQPDAIRTFARYYQGGDSADTPSLQSLLDGNTSKIGPAIYYSIALEKLDCFDALIELGASPLYTFEGWNIAHLAA
jgi:hypothetical protein